MSTKVTRKQATDILNALTARYPAEVYGTPNLRDHTHENLRPGSWSIDWEGGPYEWALHAFQDAIDDEVYQLAKDAGMTPAAAVKAARLPGTEQPHKDKVFIEPIMSFVLGLYPNG
jgi:hypothetical protein